MTKGLDNQSVEPIVTALLKDGATSIDVPTTTAPCPGSARTALQQSLPETFGRNPMCSCNALCRRSRYQRRQEPTSWRRNATRIPMPVGSVSQGTRFNIFGIDPRFFCRFPDRGGPGGLVR